MIRCDKTLSELWNLRGSVEPLSFEELKEQASDVAFMAISVIKNLQEENERYEKAMNEAIKECKGASAKTVIILKEALKI